MNIDSDKGNNISFVISSKSKTSSWKRNYLYMGQLTSENLSLPDPRVLTTRLLSSLPDPTRSWKITTRQGLVTVDKKYPLLLRIKGEAKTNCKTVASLSQLWYSSEVRNIKYRRTNMQKYKKRPRLITEQSHHCQLWHSSEVSSR